MVARETSLSDSLSAAGVPAPPGAVDKLSILSDLLLTEAVPEGYIGPHEASRLLPRHIVESACLSRFLEADEELIDVGSGAGLPGLVLACLGWPLLLIEAMEKRAAFLERAITLLRVHASVRVGRAEHVGRSDLRESADVVVARALAEPAVALELCSPLVRTGGRVLLPASPRPERATALAEVAQELMCGPPEWKDLAVPGADSTRYVMIVKKFGPTPGRFPRRPGVPKRRPLG